jgi:uncharacterized membrane protein YkvA (DUF1232 family)
MKEEISPLSNKHQNKDKPQEKWKLFFAWILVGLALIYGISPVDLVPEAVTGPIGCGEDIGLILLTLYNLYKQIKKKKNLV